MMDLVQDIINFESGDMNEEEIINFFAKLVKTGLAWQLQGSYGRMAANLIDSGFISTHGEILKQPPT